MRRRRISRITPQKRRRKTNEQKMEALRLKRRMLNLNDASTSSAIASESDYNEGGAVSAVTSEKVEPEFDLMNTMLRDWYADKKVAVAAEEKNTELEVHANTPFVTEGKSAKSSISKEGPRFKDLGGMDEILGEIMMKVILPLYQPQLAKICGMKPVTGILLHGPSGCGKTKLAHAIANETALPFYSISATEVVSGVSGASEKNISELFSKAYKTAPSIVFIDEIDAISSKRENLQRGMENRIVTQLITCMSSHDNSANNGFVLVIGATNRPDAIDPALRRPGRFDLELAMGIPNESSREKILTVLTRNSRLEGSIDLKKIARSTPGFVGADLEAFGNNAGNLAFKGIFDERKRELDPKHELNEDWWMEEDWSGGDWWREPWLPEKVDKVALRMSYFEEAVKMVQPSSRREGFSSIPNVRWDDVGGLDSIREEFEDCIVTDIKYPEVSERRGLDVDTGFLLYGPPGCGKTLIAKAVANEAGVNFIHIKGPELLDKYVGESELAIRTLFSRARTCAPCIMFFDEVDALTTKHGKEGGSVVDRVSKQLLIELNGAAQRRGVFVIGATNRPDLMDPAFLREGRFGKLLYVPLPSPDERVLILKAHARKKPVDPSVDLSAIARSKACENLSGADLAALITEAARAARKERLTSMETIYDPLTIMTRHFEIALSKTRSSVLDRQIRFYQRLSKRFKAA